MENIEKGMTYEFLICKAVVDYRWGPIIEYIRKKANESLRKDIALYSTFNRECLIKKFDYELIGDAISQLDNQFNLDGKFDRILEEAFLLREKAIKAGSFKERPVVRDYDEYKNTLVTELLVEAGKACALHKINGAEITVENVAIDDRGQFLHENGANQMVIMQNGGSPENGGETLGVVIRNSQGVVLRNVLGREATVNMSGKG
jgi:hypothetical protein